ncbi:CPBP family intramembrane metalloprotease [Candidatus Thorarchaeota archaeon]|nr:MAG: CPBP family intramembrane metalloprotease [Candidatus Thorarchaeota archaeon]
MLKSPLRNLTGDNISEEIAITVLETVKRTEEQDESSFLSRIGLVPLGLFMVALGVILRHIDVFVFSLGSTWMNILPCKVISLAVLIGVFWMCRRDQVGPILGLTNSNLKANLLVGTILGLGMYFCINVLSMILYFFIEPSVTLQFSILIGPELLAYTFIFFAINAVYEEGLFRGLLQNGFRKRYGARTGILFSAAIFGVWHLVWPVHTYFTKGYFPVGDAVVMVVFSGLLGIVFGVCYEKFTSRVSLIGPIAAHTLLNYFNESFKVALDTVVQGPDLSFVSPTHMALGLSIALLTFASCIGFFWKFRLEQVVLVSGNLLKRDLLGLQKER